MSDNKYTTPNAELQPLLHKYSDVGNGARLASYHGADLRFCPQLGWLYWDGLRWSVDHGGAEVMRRAIDSVRRLYLQASQVDDADDRAAIIDWARKSEDARRLRDAIQISKVWCGAGIDDFDQDVWALNVANGTINLRDGTLRPHNRADLITKLIPIEFDPSAGAPVFDRFLTEVFEGDNDLIAYVQRLVGYSLIGVSTEHIFVIAYGTGANGKTTFLELMHKMAGEYGRKTPSESFLARRPGTIPSDVASLVGTRLVSASEADQDRHLGEGLLKAITGGDTISARHLYKAWFQFRPQFTPWFATNHLPDVPGTDHGTWRRLKVIPFNATFTTDQQDHGLPEKLRVELPGVLAWAIAGAQDWLARGGLDEPAAVRGAVTAYRTETDTVELWINDACATGSDLWAPVRVLHKDYSTWATTYGASTMPATQFGKRLAEKDHPGDRRRVDGQQVRVRLGIALKPPAPETGETDQTPETGSLPRGRATADFAESAPPPVTPPVLTPIQIEVLRELDPTEHRTIDDIRKRIFKNRKTADAAGGTRPHHTTVRTTLDELTERDIATTKPDGGEPAWRINGAGGTRSGEGQ